MIFHPPQNLSKIPLDQQVIFLAGSIEQDKAELWQNETAKNLSDKYVVLNPRRPEWDASWGNYFEHPEFYQQVNWELDGLDDADHILFYFDPNTKSPVTLLELGYVIGKYSHRHIVVVCPDGFWRKGNVDILCYRNSIIQMDSLEQAILYFNNLR